MPTQVLCLKRSYFRVFFIHKAIRNVLFIVILDQRFYKLIFDAPEFFKTSFKDVTQLSRTTSMHLDLKVRSSCLIKPCEKNQCLNLTISKVFNGLNFEGALAPLWHFLYRPCFFHAHCTRYGFQVKESTTTFFNTKLVWISVFIFTEQLKK